METLLIFIVDHAQYAHWVVFGLLMLAGLNFPISEDLLVIISGVLASTIPENGWKLFLSLFLGAYLSDWMVYWMGRIWGIQLWRISWFARIFNPEKLKKIESYYSRFGVLTLLIGRFIPFGIRNCLFATAGIGKMHFGKFLVADGIACVSSNATLFFLAYFFGKNCCYFVKYVNIVIFSLFLIALITFIWYKRYKSNVIATLEKTID